MTPNPTRRGERAKAASLRENLARIAGLSDQETTEVTGDTLGEVNASIARIRLARPGHLDPKPRPTRAELRAPTIEGLPDGRIDGTPLEDRSGRELAAERMRQHRGLDPAPAADPIPGDSDGPDRATHRDDADPTGRKSRRAARIDAVFGRPDPTNPGDNAA